MSKYIKDFRRGDTVSLSITRTTKNNLDEDIPAPFIFGTAITLTMKSDISSASPDLVFHKTAGDSVLDNLAGGLISIILPPNLTAQLEPGKYYWDVQIVESTIMGLVTNTLLPPALEWKDRITVIADVSS
jgi:hypothetical protein